MGEIKDELEQVQRTAGRGRSEETPVIVHNLLFLIIGAFVGLLVLTILLIYYFA